MKTDLVLSEIDDVLARCGASKDRPFVRARGTTSATHTIVGNRGEIASSCCACIERNSPQRSYVEQALALVSSARLTQSNLNALLGILVSVRRDIEAGYFKTLEQRAREEVFDDLLEAATEINKLHPAPAIVLAVSVLEEHVRKLAQASGIDTIKPNRRQRAFEELTTDLRDEGVLSLPELRQVGAWYAQRTEAAHGRFGDVVAEEAPRIIAGVRDFLIRHP